MRKKLPLHDFTRMMGLMKNNIWLYLLALILGCGINSTTNIISAFVNKNMIQAAQTGNLTALKSGIILVLLAFAMACILFPVCIYIKVRVIKQVIMNIRLDLFHHLMKLPQARHDKQHSGDMVSRVINDVTIIEGAYNNQLQILGVSLMGGIGSAVTMFILDWRLAVITVMLGLASARINLSYARPLRETGDRIQSTISTLNQNIADMTAGFRTAKIFRINTVLMGRFGKENEQVAALTMNRERMNARLNSTNYLLSILSLMGIYLIGSVMVLYGFADLSTVVAVVTLQKGIQFMLQNFGQFFAQLQGSLAGASRVFEILDQQPEQEHCLTGGQLAVGQFMEVEGVSFSYDQSEVLSNLSLSLAQGKVTALVGVSGGGKSTVIKLLLGLYPLDSGRICIAGSPGTYTLKQGRELMAYVPQDCYLFTGTIEENIRYGNPGASTGEVEEAARKANAHGFIMSLADGYNTLVGEKGTRLSGGQKQRLSIARAFLKNAPVLLLDEPTSALDPDSEQQVQAAINNLVQGRTTLVITHRLSTMEKADTIYVLDKGTVSQVYYG